MKSALVLCTLIACFLGSKSFAGNPANGKKIFQQVCTACHTVTARDSATGPGLKGVTKKRKRSWLVSWIKDPTAMLKTDPEAKKLLKKFGTPMPNMLMALYQGKALDAAVEDVVSYLEEADSMKAEAPTSGKKKRRRKKKK